MVAILLCAFTIYFYHLYLSFAIMRFPTLRYSVVLYAFFSITAATAIAQNTPNNEELRVDISGFHSEKGTCKICLHNNADAFPKKSEKAVECRNVAIKGNRCTTTFTGIAVGTYAVAVYHDENDNHKMDLNYIGIPTEGYAFSNAAVGHFGPPAFSAAAFKVVKGSNIQKVVVKY